jgi:hypothetical protein
MASAACGRYCEYSLLVHGVAMSFHCARVLGTSLIFSQRSQLSSCNLKPHF